VSFQSLAARDQGAYPIDATRLQQQVCWAIHPRRHVVQDDSTSSPLLRRRIAGPRPISVLLKKGTRLTSRPPFFSLAALGCCSVAMRSLEQPI